MQLKRSWISLAVFASAIVAAGCDTASFNTFNDQFKNIKTSSGTLKASTLPAAAIATSLATVELMNAIAGDTQTKQQSGGKLGNVIAAGAGNVIAPGGGNYMLLADAEATTDYTLDDKIGTGTITVKKGDRQPINLIFQYSREATSNGYKFDLHHLEGVTNGFKVNNIRGNYAFAETGKQVNNKPEADIQCTVSGELETGTGTKFKLENLSFTTRYPNATNEKKKLGDVKLSDANGLIEGQAYIQGTTVTAECVMKDAKGNPLFSMKVDENGNPTFTEGADTAASSAAK